MVIKMKLLTAALSSVMLVGMAGAALAAPAVATSNVNVRSGPGTNYQAVDTLRRGERVDVEGCRAGWCYIDGRGAEGWVSWQYLAETSRPTRPSTVFQFNFGSPPRWEAPGRPNAGPSRPGPGRDNDGRPGDNRPDRPGDNNGPGRGNGPDRSSHDNSGPARPVQNQGLDRKNVNPPAAERPASKDKCSVGMPNWPNCRPN